MSHAGKVVAAARTMPRIKRAAFELSDSAAQRIKVLMNQKQDHPLGVRVSLKQRGCNGMSYTLKYVTEMDLPKYSSDEVVQDKGVKVFIDPRALLNIAGTRMDYSDTELASEFVFTNPNAESTCGW